jgi:hypothetical protein
MELARVTKTTASKPAAAKVKSDGAEVIRLAETAMIHSQSDSNPSMTDITNHKDNALTGH